MLQLTKRLFSSTVETFDIVTTVTCSVIIGSVSGYRCCFLHSLLAILSFNKWFVAVGNLNDCNPKHKLQEKDDLPHLPY